MTPPLRLWEELSFPLRSTRNNGKTEEVTGIPRHEFDIEGTVTIDAEKLGMIRTGDLMKVHTEIGFFVLHAWITEGIAPGVVACSHHLGRWRVNKEDRIERFSSAWGDLKEVGKGQWKMRQIVGVEPYESSDPDTQRVWWSDAGVHQDITFPVHPIRSVECTAGTRWFAWSERAKMIVTAASSWIPIFRARFIKGGKLWLGQLRDPGICVVRCGSRGWHVQRKRHTTLGKYRCNGMHSPTAPLPIALPMQ